MHSQLEHRPSQRSSSPVGLAKWFGSDVLQQPLPSMPTKVISVDELEYRQWAGQAGSLTHQSLDLWWHPGQDSASSSHIGLQLLLCSTLVWSCLGHPGICCGLHYDGRNLTSQWSLHGLNTGCSIVNPRKSFFVRYVNEVLVSSPRGGWHLKGSEEINV